MKNFTLSRNERLKSRKQIELLFREGKHANIFPFRFSWMQQQSGTEPLQFGVGVSSRWFKKAVDRNRVKRLVRESWRLQKNSLKDALLKKQSHLIVFIVFTGKEIPSYEMVYKATEKVLENLIRMVNETADKNT